MTPFLEVLAEVGREVVIVFNDQYAHWVNLRYQDGGSETADLPRRALPCIPSRAYSVAPSRIHPGGCLKSTLFEMNLPVRGDLPKGYKNPLLQEKSRPVISCRHSRKEAFYS